jgi:hypothetical protein
LDPSDPVDAVLLELKAELDQIVKNCNRHNTRLVREAKAKIEELKGTRQGRARIRHIIYVTSKKVRRHTRHCIERIHEVCSQYKMALDDLADFEGIVVTEDDYLKLQHICRRHVHRIRSHTEYLLSKLAPDRDSPDRDGTEDDTGA